MRRLAGLILILFGTTFSAWAQAPAKLSASEIQLALNKLNVLGSVLYVAAHPDDENQVVIGYMSQTRQMNTGYLSLTRGDGGQNLIGPEIRELLGVVRTQELIQARGLDGSHQFFTRAIDFGYSKTADETLALWDKRKILADVVWVIRQFRPDVIITRFPPDERAGHGHHTTSGILAAEAFDIAGDAQQFPEQLQYVKPWQPKRLYLNDTDWFTKSIDSVSAVNDSILRVDMGVYNPLLGKSVPEIAAESRSKHESQGFGATGSRGTRYEYFRYVKGDLAQNHLLEGVDTTWSRVVGGEAVGNLLAEAARSFDPEHPAQVVPTLMEASEALDQLSNGHWKTVKRQALNRVIQACLGLYLEVRGGTNALTRRFRSSSSTQPGIAEYSATPGDTVTFNIEAINRSGVAVSVQELSFPGLQRDTVMQLSLPNNIDTLFTLSAQLPPNMPYTEPYWLRTPHDGFTFQILEQMQIGRDESPEAITARFELLVAGHPLSLEMPVVYKSNNPRSGETYRPFVVVPPVDLEIEESVRVFADNEAKSVRVLVRAGTSRVSGTLSLQLPDGWVADPVSHDFSLALKEQKAEFTFQVTPPSGQSVGEAQAVATIDGKAYDQQKVIIDYEHIPTQTLLLPATAKLVKLDLKKEGQAIGYIMGAGDDIPQALEQVGYRVTLLAEDDIRPSILNQFDAIMVGIRAYNTVDWLRYQNNRLLEYAKNGGTLIVQYNTNRSLISNSFTPYTLELSRDRVADEAAEVRFLQPGHPVLNTPNKITKHDFEGWVQERGLYFPGKWDEQYEAILSLNDPGEDPKESSLLVAPYGKGYYIYTGLSFFRELPAGVPGAYRLLTNLLSVGKEAERGR